VPVVDALQDRGELERREPEVEADTRQVRVAARGAAGDDLVLGQEPGAEATSVTASPSRW
jgi:hypothetical protein